MSGHFHWSISKIQRNGTTPIDRIGHPALFVQHIPIFQENRDNITGYIFRELVFEKLAEDQFNLRLKDTKRKIIHFPENVTLFDAWEEMLNKKEHISLIIDEYGGMDGAAAKRKENRFLCRSADLVQDVWG